MLTFESANHTSVSPGGKYWWNTKRASCAKALKSHPTYDFYYLAIFLDRCISKPENGRQNASQNLQIIELMNVDPSQL